MVLSYSGSHADAKFVFREAMVTLFTMLRRDPLALSISVNTFLYSVSRYIWFKELSNKKRRPKKLASEESHINIDQNIIDLIELNERLRLYRQKFEELSEEARKFLKDFYCNTSDIEGKYDLPFNHEYQSIEKRYRFKKLLINRILGSSEFKRLGYE